MLVFASYVQIEAIAAVTVGGQPVGGDRQADAVFTFGKLDRRFSTERSEVKKHIHTPLSNLALHAPAALSDIQKRSEQKHDYHRAEDGQNNKKQGGCKQNKCARLQNGKQIAQYPHGKGDHPNATYVGEDTLPKAVGTSLAYRCPQISDQALSLTFSVGVSDLIEDIGR